MFWWVGNGRGHDKEQNEKGSLEHRGKGSVKVVSVSNYFGTKRGGLFTRQRELTAGGQRAKEQDKASGTITQDSSFFWS